jgi:hypothetical protein
VSKRSTATAGFRLNACRFRQLHRLACFATISQTLFLAFTGAQLLKFKNPLIQIFLALSVSGTSLALSAASFSPGRFSATEAEINSASCKKRFPLTDSEISNWLKKKTASSKPIPSTLLAGYSFINESAYLLEIFKLLQEKPPQLDWNGNLNYNLPAVQSSCNKVLCALGEIYGSHEALRMIYILGEYGYNTSPIQRSNARALTFKELSVLTTVLSDMPTFLRKKNPVRPLTVTNDSGPSGNATIQLFRQWSLVSPLEQNYVVYHELSHNLAEYAFHKADESTVWTRIASIPQAVSPQNCLSEYACSSPVEYFAEGFVSYRYSPLRLRNFNPKMYSYFKNLYQNVEYLSEDSCKAVHPEYMAEKALYQSLKDKMDSAFRLILKTRPALETEIQQQCFKEITKTIPNTFKNAKRIDLLSEDCTNAELLRLSGIRSDVSTGEELILGLQPHSRLKALLSIGR